MTQKEIEQKVNDVFKDVLGTDEVTAEKNLIDDLGADSLDAVELIMSLEKDLNIRIEDEDADRCETVGDVYQLVERLVNQ